jgi:hypothetical protein
MTYFHTIDILLRDWSILSILFSVVRESCNKTANSLDEITLQKLCNFTVRWRGVTFLTLYLAEYRWNPVVIRFHWYNVSKPYFLLYVLIYVSTYFTPNQHLLLKYILLVKAWSKSRLSISKICMFSSVLALSAI